MSEPIIQAISKACPHCPTRRECACPDGPEKCPDNPKCPCDKTLCPCGKHAHRPEDDPPGCLRGPLWLGIGAVAIIGIVVVLILILTGGDDGSDSSPGPQLSVASTTVPASATVPATDPTVPTDPPFEPPLIGPGVDSELASIFGGSPVIQTDRCIPATVNMQQVDETGGSPLTDPSLAIEAFCLQRVNLDGSQVPMFVGDYFVAATVHQAPLDPTTNIEYQPAIGFDRPGIPNTTPQDSGEGMLQVAIDTMAVGQFGEGWQEARFYSVPGFTPSDMFGYSFTQPGSRVTAFAIPTDQVPADTLLYLQSFGRLTAEGAAPANSDPSSSTLIHVGPVPCFDECGVTAGRFKVDVTWAADPTGVVGGVESPDGAFWFFTPENVEMLVKVLNACEVPGANSYWVYASELTGGEVTVTDTQTGGTKTYSNAANTPGAPIFDTSAFATCP